jgi:1,4-dihydroxy-2-naphthoate octaprenyltransferase
MKVTAWLQSARLPSQLYLGLALAVGWSLAARAGQPAPLALLILLHAYGTAQQLFIVWANDVADLETDRANATATPFSGGSRVLVAGSLSPLALTRAYRAAAVIAMALTVVMAVAFERPAAPLFGLAGLALLQAYSFAPLRLSYRGGGAWLQVAGLGLHLPLFALYLCGAPFDATTLLPIAMLLPAQFGCAIATTLPDEPSDRASNKRSFTVANGATFTTIAATLGLATSSAALFATDAHRGLLVAALAVSLKQGLLGRTPPGSKALSLRLALLVGAALLLQLAVVLGA